MVKFSSFKSTVWVLTGRRPSLQSRYGAFHHPTVFLQASFLPVFPCTSALDNHWSAFCHCSSAFSKIFYKWNPTVFSFVPSFHSAWCSWDSTILLACAIGPRYPWFWYPGFNQPHVKNIQKKKFQKAPKNKTGIYPLPATIFIACTLGIINNLLLDQIGSARLRPWSQSTDIRL